MATIQAAQASDRGAISRLHGADALPADGILRDGSRSPGAEAAAVGAVGSAPATDRAIPRSVVVPAACTVDGLVRALPGAPPARLVNALGWRPRGAVDRPALAEPAA